MNTTQFRSQILNDVYNEYFDECYDGDISGGWLYFNEEGSEKDFEFEKFEDNFHYEFLWEVEFLPHPSRWWEDVEALDDDEKQTLIDELNDPTRENPGAGARPNEKQSVDLTYQMFEYVRELLMTPDPAGDLVFKTYHDSL